MNDSILELSQGIFDRIASVDISQQSQAYEEISRILGESVFFGTTSLSLSDKKWIPEELEYLLVNMTSSAVQNVHILIFGKEHDSRDIIPF